MTLILPKLNYVAVPKTGTIAIERVLGEYAEGFSPHQHHTLKQVRTMSSSKCVGVIREPLEWIESYYRYLRWSPYFARSDSIWGLRSKSFEQFVQAFVKGRVMWPEPKRFQSDYLTNEDDIVDIIYTYDQLNDVFELLSQDVSNTKPLKVENKGRVSNLEISDDLINEYYNYVSKDVELYEKVKLNKQE